VSAPATAETLASRLDKLYEFEREPISPDQLKSGRYFAAMFAGEHVAGTEFVIGALFVQWGAMAGDLVWGLLIGNLLAVLSWAFICAPIAVRVRLTLYWYARRIIGPGLTVIYNIVNAVLYCCLAAAMIGVSASAVIQAFNKIERIPHIKHPELTDVYPPGIGWIVVVLLVGAVVVVLAIAGFKKLSQFAAVCSPWMFPIFVAGALVTLPRLGDCRSLADLRNISETRVWTGQPLKPCLTLDDKLAADLDQGYLTPGLSQALSGTNGRSITLSADAAVQVEQAGLSWRLVDQNATYLVRKADGRIRVSQLLNTRLGFWHILFFAWFCNLAMHIGLSDMAVFRYARRQAYGFYSAFGMYLGHYAAWACAGIMGAAAAAGLARPLGQIDSGSVAYQALGTMGALAVVLAGWTTANPTLYRAGLALQVLTPGWPRWLVTLVVGLVTTVIACFPFVFTGLLDFVGIYGLLLSPVGAIVVTEHWIFPWLGWTQYRAARRGVIFHWPALLAWSAALAVGAGLWQIGHAHLFFVAVPVWVLTALLYLGMTALGGPRRSAGALPDDTEKSDRGLPIIAPAPEAGSPGRRARTLGIVAAASLLTIAALAWVVFSGRLDPDRFKSWITWLTIAYFGAGVLWMKRRA